MEIHDKIAEIVRFIDSARTMPMSSSAIVNKEHVLMLLDEVREGLPGSLQAAEAVIAQREALLVEARGNAERIVADGRSEHARLVADHAVTQSARIEAEDIVQLARDQADAIRADADDYVDAKLARLEVAAQRIAETVRDGREQLRRPTPYEELAKSRNGRGPVEDVRIVDDESADLAVGVGGSVAALNAGTLAESDAVAAADGDAAPADEASSPV